MIRSLNMIATSPYPPRSGGDLRAWNLCRNLAPRMDQTVLCREIDPLPVETEQAFAEHSIGLSTVRIPRRSTVARSLKALRHSCSAYPIMQGGWDHAPMHQRLRELLRREAYDIVVLDGSMLCSYVPDLEQTHAIKVVNLYDLQPLFLKRLGAVMRPGIRKLIVKYDAWKMRYAEAAMLAAADLILVTSDREKRILAELDPNNRVVVVRNGVDCESVRPLPRNDRNEVLFVGSLHYHPNVDGVRFFVRDVWPALREQNPDLVFTIVGRDPPPEIIALHNVSGIRVMGEVADLTPYYEDAVFSVVPLRAGGGTRLKVLESMAYGRPVLSTTLGCEGLGVVDDVHVLLADSPAQMVQQAGRLLSQPNLRERLCAGGRALVEEEYAWSSIADGLYEQYETLHRARSEALRTAPGAELSVSPAGGSATPGHRSVPSTSTQARPYGLAPTRR